MHFTKLLALPALAAVVANPAIAQDAARAPSGRVSVSALTFHRFESSEPEHRAALGVGTTATGTLRDTLGIMITSITKGSPAEKAGLEEGNRIASINGVSLKANPADVEDADMSNALTRRLTRELGKVKAGDEVDLRVYRDGKTQSMRIRTADAEVLFGTADRVRTRTREVVADRPALGFSLGSTGSRRDTLGVLVMSVADSSPAAKAGIEEGNRIAAINGVSLRVGRDDAGDRYLSSTKVNRLQREIAALKPGENVTLSVYSNGRTRDMTLQVVRASELPKSFGGMTMFGDGFGFVPAMPSMPMLPSVPALPSMPRVAPMAPFQYRMEYTPEIRERMEEARAQLNSIRPLLEMNLQRARPSIRMESIRPQLDQMRSMTPRPAIAPRIRIVNTVM